MLALAVVLTALTLTNCKEKKHSDDIIVRKVVKQAPEAPIKMQEYNMVKDLIWLGKNYQVDIRRVADDSLRKVKDENGQPYVDNRITLRIIRADGSVFFNRAFTKAAFEPYLDADYRLTGILEGFVFDKVDGDNLVFASSVCHPGTDEYIPFVVTVSRMGDVGIRRDSDLDTTGDEDDSQ